MNSKANKVVKRRRHVSRSTSAPASPLLTPKRITFPLEMILYMANFMCFQDYRRFILSLYPNYVMSDLIWKKLWELSTYRTETVFINGKPMVIEYNFDPSRIREDRILMNVETLSPIFGRIVSPTIKKFTGVSELKNFVKMHTHLNQCSGGQFASCPCHLVDKNGRGLEAFEKPLTDACPYGHYHHYCAHHVASWLNILEGILMQLQQQRHCFSEDLARSFILSMDESVYVHGVEMQRHGCILYRMLTM
ncbi:repeat element protein-d4.2 [Ichnoviriform fugitivi]|uniref:Repeat element protein-d4.2 n=1 Tax=Ichnoviriform fugitivi TaxID=265522 RepID=A2Q0K6_9VIRU|nr:repeat element protein-d4.2 [Ichnoviriform fugitivi]BAF45721.1 repeat element protein-d4.2 [Ichnoviriform fugitivi]